MSGRALGITQAINLVAGIFVQHGATELQARPTARALVLAEMDGQPGHGFSRVASYAGQLATGKVNGTAIPTATQPATSVCRIDAGFGFAYPALDLAIEQLVQTAPRHGVAIAAVTQSHHCGSLGLVVERLAQAGLVGLMVANTPSAMAPWGGSRALFGTNPIAGAFPRDDGEPPVVVDLSLSVVARGKVLAAQQRNQPIPEGWALDRHGRSTTDPSAALAGTMLPMGGAKGAALALLVEALAAGLTGAQYASDASSFLDAEGAPPATGQLLIAIDPAATGGAGTAGHLATLFDAVQSDEGARLPGAHKAGRRRRGQLDGIDVPDSVLGLANQ